MKKEVLDSLKYDPSNTRQNFSDIRIQLHCCHYWMIEEWESTNLASPFWRLYHNTIGDAHVTFNGATTKLTANQLLIIPPNTAFSSCLKKGFPLITSERHVRRKINSWSELSNPTADLSDHLFIHFNLGLPYDIAEPGIYTFAVMEHEEKLLNEIKEYCIKDENVFDFAVCTAINLLILKLLHNFPSVKWGAPIVDKRVANTLTYIARHIGDSLTNKTLAELASMAENSFARLFREHMGVSIHQYIKRKRIDKSLILLHHSNNSIDAIARACGFSDRPHFSRVFREMMKTSPVAYRKGLFY